MSKPGLRRLAFASLFVGLVAPTPQPAAARRLADEGAFQFFSPWVTVSKAEHERLARDDVVVRILPDSDGRLATFAVTRLDAPPEALVAWTHAIAELKRGRFLVAAGSFSDPPELSDLDGLTLDDADVDALGGCVPGDCPLKLSAPEIASMQRVVAGAEGEWRDDVQYEFRRLLLARVNLYRSDGLAGLPPIAARRTPLALDDVFTAIMGRSPYVARLPALAASLQGAPRAEVGMESFFYWSKEHYGVGKAVVSVTHVTIVRPEGAMPGLAVLVCGKQLFATRYVNGALSLTAILQDAGNGTRYLAYLNRSHIDLLKGLFGPFMRAVIERRVTRDAPEVVGVLRSRLESGSPPPARID